MSTIRSQAFELARLDFSAIELELTRPFVTSRKTITRREVIVLRATIQVDGASVMGYGEVAPLPGWSDETVADCAAILEALEGAVSVESIENLDAALPQIGKYPTLRFGVELALLDALARHKKTTIAQLIYERFSPEVVGDLPTAIALQSTVGAVALDALLEHATLARQEGYEVLKVKVGADPLHDDIAKIATLCALAPELKLRLDANGAWSVAEALGITHTIARDFPTDGIDLVEQPVAVEDFDDFLTQFAAQAEQRGASSNLAIAADESADSYTACARLIEGGAMRAVVLKPSTLGGLLPSAKLIALAIENDVRVVLSNLIASAIGRRAVAQLAAAFPQVAGPHGLATGGWFREDTAPDADRIEGAKFILSGAHGLGFVPTVAFTSTEGA
ncbi:o-succinylbenzoate synthase [Bradymonas sediminis]|uniref:o-succinylbenzoate synthase n=1 Tax=Bradymonas sediminis TaxID=1548548 RepID=A0A2Z4FID0_9DELT|nr:o-succinylbenzoate synthase [Bradymonas sediminis]AWV88448.1 o-succinylbenzoate synthase [Bradymonas sediminis]TDP77578.1 o-succinylbenzoate synthase [Bradymonas sediminis]